NNLLRHLMKSNDVFDRACAFWDRGKTKEALRLFLKGAKEGDGSSQLNVGYFYDLGLGVRKNPDLALYWYRRAHRRGNSSAANNIGTIYRDRGQTRKALEWFNRALKKGNIDS